MKRLFIIPLFILVLYCSWQALVILAGSSYLALCVIGWQFLAAVAAAVIKSLAESIK